MNKVTTTILVLVALGAGWLLGTVGFGDGSVSQDDERMQLREENARLHRALGERGPRLNSVVGLRGARSGAAGTHESGAAHPPAVVPERVEAFDLAKFEDPDLAFQTFLAYARTMLDRGADGHLALLATIDATFAQKAGEARVRELVGGEEQVVRYLYPVIRFALNHDAQVVDMTETVFRTMAEHPKRLEKISNNALGLFTEGVAVMLPGMVGPKRLARLRTHAQKILATPQAEQPRSVQRQRRDLQRALASWAPPVSVDEAIQRLQQGTASAEEAMALLRRLGPDDVKRLDLDALVGPLLETDGWRMIGVLSRLKPDEATLRRLDTRIVGAVNGGKMPQSLVQYWLRYTGRTGWPKAREFIESGLQQADAETSGVFLMTALDLTPPPDEAWIAWAERTYTFSNRVRLFLQKRHEKK